MSARLSVAELNSQLANFVASLLEGLAQLRKDHSHSELILPPDLTFPILDTRISEWASNLDLLKEESAEHIFAEKAKLLPELAPDAHQRDQDERKKALELVREDAQVKAQRHNQLVEARTNAFGQFLRVKVTQRPGSSRASTSTNLDDVQLRELFDRCDVLLSFELAGLCEAVAPLTVIEGVMETLPLEGCSKMLDYIDSRKAQITVNFSGTTSGSGRTRKGAKSPVLLRICNDLRRRLAKPFMRHTILSGRIASLLTEVFPLGERSGLNTRGDFHIDNKTIIKDQHADGGDEGETPAEEAEQEGGANSAEGSKAGEKTLEERATSDADFYILFWSMQQFFANPSLIFEADSVLPPNLLPRAVHEPHSQVKEEKIRDERERDHGSRRQGKEPDEDQEYEKGLHSDAGGLKEFKYATQRILDLLMAVNERELMLNGSDTQEESRQQSNANGGEAGPDAMDTDQAEEEEEPFFPKYLTGRELLDSEVREPSFRRQILVQFLILLQYILEFRQARKAKWAARCTNKTLLRSWVLTEASAEWCNSTWKQILTHLNQIPGPRAYAVATKNTMRREHNWAEWKAMNCQPMEVPPMTKSEMQSFETALSNLFSKLPIFPQRLGTPALSKLWDNGVPPPQAGTTRRENEDGVYVHVATDGLEELEWGPRANDFDAYAHKWRKLETKSDQRRSEIGLPKGVERRENDLRRKVRNKTARTQLNTMQNAKIRIQTLQLRKSKLAEELQKLDLSTSQVAAAQRNSKQEELLSLEKTLRELQSAVPSADVQKQLQEVYAKSTVELKESDASIKKERRDLKAAPLLEQGYSVSWRALRLASQQHLRLLGQVPMDDLELLSQAIEGKFNPSKIIEEEIQAATPVAPEPAPKPTTGPFASTEDGVGQIVLKQEGSLEPFALSAPTGPVATVLKTEPVDHNALSIGSTDAGSPIVDVTMGEANPATSGS
ncbi:hypothetical protein K437DRAFT_253308 [Tilletiaria anomala UBC 951]|uniref:Uncharacterized protein n=1 Tax=Tilletiaria anomala (strain ATCC 24038 / CBS 436.72 / UBC 951) TaxID=1037660 RepID=A0A066WRJ8_TILAU|nr:uncharacterized protein K437DRAFT_253308 [Tilletiaria anomala UBC 951]KDN53285.1 hypothetical protein K437DRAFT_253308 [Tilletiaria anomala UBC 951]